MDRSPWYAFGNALPYLDSIVYHIVEDFDTELAMFKAGETDVHGVLGEEYAVLEAAGGGGELHHLPARTVVRHHVPHVQPKSWLRML